MDGRVFFFYFSNAFKTVVGSDTTNRALDELRVLFKKVYRRQWVRPCAGGGGEGEAAGRIGEGGCSATKDESPQK